MNRPRLFLSAVSSEFRSARQRVATTVRTLGFDPVSQDDFPTGHGDLRHWLCEQIDSCEGLIQIAGDGCGAEPPEVDADYGRVSYTQFEMLHARRRGKKTWLIIAGEHVGRDTPLAQLDLLDGADPCDSVAHQAQRHQLQQNYIARLQAENHLYHTASNDAELENIVLKLRDELGELRRSAKRHQRRMSAAVVAVLLGLILLGSGEWWGYQHLQANVQQVGVLSTERIRAHLRETVEETYRSELAESDKINDWKQRQRLRDAAEATHIARLAKIDELAASFAEIGGRGLATSVFQEMTRILSQQGVDEAIAYVDGQRATILQTVRARAAAASTRNRADLQPLLQVAALHENKGQAAEARALYADILEIEPDWPVALHSFFWFLLYQGDAAGVRATQVEVRREYEEALRLALRLTKLEPINTDWQGDLSASYGRLGDVAAMQGNLEAAARAYGYYHAIAAKLAADKPGDKQLQRDLSVSHEKLGDLAMAQGRLSVAEQAYGDSLTLRKKLSTGDSNNMMWQRDLAVSFNKIGDVGRVQGRLDDASRAYGDSLVIAKRLASVNPSNIQWQRDLSFTYQRLGTVALEQDKMDVAARLFSDGLVIAKKWADNDPRNIVWQSDISIFHERLGDVAVERGELDAATASYRESRIIRKRLAEGDPSNPLWPRDLSVSINKLGDMAVAQGQFDAGARAYSEGLAIRKKLVAGDASNVQWQRDLSMSFFRLSKLQALQKQWSDAIANAEASLKADEWLSQLDRSNANWQADVKTSRVWLDHLRQQAAANK